MTESVGDGAEAGRKLKVGFLVDDVASLNLYACDLIDHVNESALFEAPTVITGHARGKPRRPTWSAAIRSGRGGALARRAFRAALFRLVRKLEGGAASRRFPRFGGTRDIRDMGLPTIEAEARWSPGGQVVRFSDSALDEIRDAGLDVIIRTGGGILKGGILEAAKFGILSFHHGDNRTNRGGPSGFWEVVEDRPTSGFVIQQLSEDLDGGRVVFRGSIMTSNTWTMNNASLLEKSMPFMKLVLDRLAAERALPFDPEPALYDRPLYRLAHSSQLLGYIAKVYGKFAARRLAGWLLGSEAQYWGVAYAADATLGGSLFRYKEIPNPPGRYLADPFIIRHGERTVCFVEDYSHETRKGSISAVELAREGPEYLGPVLEEDWHLSYPFVFERDGTVYMVPESAACGEVRLYKCTSFPGEWQLHRVLMKQPGADPCLVERNGTWFMLVGLCSAGIGDRGSELHVFSADSFDSTDWRPIAGNPVIADATRARNGGMFEHEGELIRVNQINGKAFYGHKFALNVVEHLGTDGYRERRVQEISPRFFKGIVGTHHFHTNGEYSAVDYKRVVRTR